jgi:hypothetical protein
VRTGENGGTGQLPRKPFDNGDELIILEVDVAVRRAGMALAVLCVPLALAVPVQPDIRVAAHAVTADPGGGYRDARCADAAATWMGGRWPATMEWRLAASTSPAYLGSTAAVRDMLRRAGENVDLGINPCGLAEDLDTAQRFDGDTRAVAGVTGDGGCGIRDGANVVSFGPLPAGVLAVTCVWWVPGEGGADGRAVEADILINDAVGLYAPVSASEAGCVRQWDLEGAITHEFGHVFGLGHVSAAAHPGLTMSDGLAPCDFSHRGLGLGDYDMLRAHYGAG